MVSRIAEDLGVSPQQVAQGQALLHAEAVLFVDDNQGQAFELHRVLEQGVGADNYVANAAFEILPNDFFLALLCAPGQELHPHAERHK